MKTNLVKHLQPNSTLLYAIGVNPNKGHFYNLEINQGVDGRGVDGVQLSSQVSGSTHLRIQNNLTVTSGTTKMTTTEGNNGYLLEDERIGRKSIFKRKSELFKELDKMMPEEDKKEKE